MRRLASCWVGLSRPTFWTTRSAQERELTAAGTHRTTSRSPSILGPEAGAETAGSAERVMQNCALND
jgi:hypothetical protein